MKAIRYVPAILLLLTGMLHLVLPHRFPSLLNGLSFGKLLASYVAGFIETGLGACILITGANKAAAYGILGLLCVYMLLVRFPQLWDYYYTKGFGIASLLAEALSLALLLLLSAWVLLRKARPFWQKG